MDYRSQWVFILLLGLLVLRLAAAGWCAQPADDGIYAELLQKHVRDGIVDYQGFKNDESKLDMYLKLLEQTNTKELSRNQQLAFYINAYNAWTIKLVVGAYPGIKSIKDLGGLLGSPWSRRTCRLDGEIISLEDLEHRIIRGRFDEPRIHFAINCASKSCPMLISVPYQGAILDQQLDEAAKAFINNPGRNRLEGKILYVSKIFDWFQADFKGGVLALFLRYGEGELKRQLIANKDHIRIDYLNYDWSLNGE